MIESIYIKNFKKFDRETIKIEQHNIFIGENDSGKSTVLQALDIFFNQEKIEKIFARNQSEPIEIGIRYNGVMYKKIYSGATYRVTEIPENIDDLNNIKYIYIPVGKYNVSEIIQQLSIAKVLENTNKELLDELKRISQNSINEVISGIDKDLIVLNQDTTNILGKEKFSYNSSLKFAVETDGVSVEARGSGFQKNLLYALLIGNQYNNVILGIDEIENSFSVNNAKAIIKNIHERIGQTLFTTHSPQILNARNNANIHPLFSDNNKSLIELLESLDDTNNKDYVLVEGLYDLNWVKTAINLLGKSNEYIVLPSGGCGNIEHLRNELESYNKKCYLIKDGDTNEEKSLSKDCIELYAPLEAINEILGLDLKHIPVTKEEFFNLTEIEGVRNNETVKSKLSKEINKYLKFDNPLVQEIEALISDN